MARLYPLVSMCYIIFMKPCDIKHALLHAAWQMAVFDHTTYGKQKLQKIFKQNGLEFTVQLCIAFSQNNYIQLARHINSRNTTQNLVATEAKGSSCLVNNQAEIISLAHFRKCKKRQFCFLSSIGRRTRKEHTKL